MVPITKFIMLGVNTVSTLSTRAHRDRVASNSFNFRGQLARCRYDRGVLMTPTDMNGRRGSSSPEVVITGRLKDVIIVGGRNYYPQDIEAAAETAAHAVLRPGRVDTRKPSNWFRFWGLQFRV